MILNLTQHVATQEQLEAGVIEPTPEFKKFVQAQITFNTMPTREEIKERVVLLGNKTSRYLRALNIENGVKPTPKGTKIMIGGAPYLMGPLESYLKAVQLVPVYAYSERVSEEVVQDDGSVSKINVFKHLGFVEA